MEHRKIQPFDKLRTGWQRAEVGGQKSEIRRQQFSCESGFPRPACPGRNPGELVEGQPRSCDFNGLNDLTI